MNASISAQLNLLQSRIRECEIKYKRPSHSVSLLAVSKGQSLEKILQAIAAGQTAFGENYLQEALPKILALSDKNLGWHFIGTIQRNKTKKIAEQFQWVHSVNHFDIAKRLNTHRPPHLPPLNICLEVNISEESTKSGVHINDIFSLADQCLTLPHLTLRGLMALPEPKNNFTEQRNEFKKLRECYETLREKGYSIDTLSMGMSHDWEAAIAEGATWIRIGTALFGER